MMKKLFSRKNLKVFSLIAVILTLVMVLTGCDFILDLLDQFLNQGGGEYNPQLREGSAQSQLFKPHYDLDAEEGDRDLPIDSVNQTENLSSLAVGNTTQVGNALKKLLDTVVAGKRPILSEDLENPVTAVYHAARVMLRTYVNDDDSDYIKVRTIYEWIVWEVDYDYDLLDEYMEKNGRVDGDDYAFHLSGVFVCGLAVCDGMSKAFSLLCAMEGIQVQRVLGWYPDYNEDGSVNVYVGHAWNKVKIAVPGNPEKAWYFVDVTFANMAINNGDNTFAEYLTFAYFLLTDTQSNDHLQDDEWTVRNNNKTLTAKTKAPSTDYSWSITYAVCNTSFDFFSIADSNHNGLEMAPAVSSHAALSSYLNSFAEGKPSGSYGVELKISPLTKNQIYNYLFAYINSKPSNYDARWTFAGKDDEILILFLVI